MRKLLLVPLVFSFIFSLYFISSSYTMGQDCHQYCVDSGYDTSECSSDFYFCNYFPKCENNQCKYDCITGGDGCYSGYCYCYNVGSCDCDTKVCKDTVGCSEPSCSDWTSYGCNKCLETGCQWCNKTLGSKCVKSCYSSWPWDNCYGGACIKTIGSCPAVCDDGYVSTGELCDPPTSNSTQCSQSPTYVCIYGNDRKVGVRDNYGDCNSQCQCIEDIFTYGETDDQDYCNKCNHCTDGTQNCNEEGVDCGESAGCDPCPKVCSEYTLKPECDTDTNCAWCTGDNKCKNKASVVCQPGECSLDKHKKCTSTCTWEDCANTDASCYCNNGECVPCGVGEKCENWQCVAGECPLAEHNSCDKALAGKIACGETLSDCLNKTDDKYYKIGGSAGKEVNVTVEHTGDYCNQNDLFIYNSSCKEIGRSTGNKKIDSWKGETDKDIIVRITGDNTQNENCQWELKVECKSICPESYSGRVGDCSPRNVPTDCDQANCGLEVGVKEYISGCLYAYDSKYFSVDYWKGREIEVTLTNDEDSGCNKNSLGIHKSNCDLVESVESEDATKTWVGTVPYPSDLQKDMLIVNLTSNSENKNCLWELRVGYVSVECESICVVKDGPDCSPFGCSNGRCTSVCDSRCGADSVCSGKGVGDTCGTGKVCDSDCKCVEGIPRSIELKRGWNMISQPFETFEIDTNCELDPEANIYDYDTLGESYRVVSSLEETVGGYGCWVKVENDCEMVFIGAQPTTYIDLETGWNMIGTVNNEELTVNELKKDCVVTKTIYKYDTSIENYAVVTYSLEPGIGYWVKADDDCTID